VGVGGGVGVLCCCLVGVRLGLGVFFWGLVFCCWVVVGGGVGGFGCFWVGCVFVGLCFWGGFGGGGLVVFDVWGFFGWLLLVFLVGGVGFGLWVLGWGGFWVVKLLSENKMERRVETFLVILIPGSSEFLERV